MQGDRGGVKKVLLLLAKILKLRPGEATGEYGGGGT